MRRTTVLSSRLVPCLLTILALATASDAVAQCGNVWLPGEGVPGTTGVVRVTATWDPDGAGPRQPVAALGTINALTGSNALTLTLGSL